MTSTANKVVWAVSGGLVLAVCGFLFWVWGINVLHWFTTDFREFSSFWMLFLGGVVAAIVLLLIGSAKNSSPILGTAWVLAGVGLIAGIGVNWLVAPYETAKTYYEASTVTVPNSKAPSYSERTPYEVAVRTSDKNLLNITGDSQTTKALADEGDSGEWNTLVVEKGVFKGYEVVQNMNLPLYGTAQNSNVKFCEFSKDATLRDHGALPHNNLSRAVFYKVPLNVTYDGSDLYGYCNEAKEPVVVVPLKEIDGFLFPTWKPYGVAVYNGKTGALDIVTDADKLKDIPGPVYPQSLAATQRNSLIANGTWGQMVIDKVSGYIAASDNTEVGLRRADSKDVDYVTSLMPRGSSTSIVAVSHVSSNLMVPGQYNKLTVEEFPKENVRSANSTLVDDLKSRFSYMPDIVNDSIGVFEITSGKDGGWVVSLGREQSVNYRAYISPNGENVQMFDRNKKLIAQGSTSTVTDENGAEQTTVDLTPTEVSKLSTDELNKLGKAVMDELAKRAK